MERSIRLLEIRPVTRNGEASAPAVRWIAVSGTHEETIAAYQEMRNSSPPNTQVTLYSGPDGRGRRVREAWGTGHC